MENFDSLCMNCFEPLTAGSVCRSCGFDNDRPNETEYLPLRTVLDNRYVIGHVQAHESDAAIYAAYDTTIDSVCVVREFLPKGIANRLEGNMEVHVRERFRKNYDGYKKDFADLWQTMLSMRSLAAALPVYDVFAANETVYAVMEAVEGVTLREFLLRTPEGYIPWEQARIMFMPVLTTLETLHSHNIIHGSITPDNLILCPDGKVRLKGFCISQCNTVNSELEFNLNEGYTAIEQYDNNHKMCPATDIYAFSACIYRALVGSNPPDAPSRETNDKLMIPNKIAETIPTHVIRALGAGLQIYPEKRAQSASRMRELLNAAPNVVAQAAEPVVHEEQPVQRREEPKPQPKPEPVKKNKKSGKNKALIIVLVVLIIAAIGAGIYVVKFSGLVGGNEPTTDAVSVVNCTVPNFISAGYTESDIKNNGAWNEQFTITYTSEYSEDVEEGIVFKQSIESGTEVPQGTEIVLTVSKGIQTAEVPDVGGLTLEEAKKSLEDKGFKVSSVEVYNDGTHTANTVKATYGMAPAARTMAAVGSEVVLQVYGEEQTTTEPESTTQTQTQVQEVE